jgi:hypothetical protein
MSVAPESGRNRIMIYGPKNDGTYIVEFMSACGASRTSEDVRLESAKWAKADFDQACCGTVSNVCCVGMYGSYFRFFAICRV